MATGTRRAAYRAPDVGSPLWWVERLHEQISQRARAGRVFNDYYEGNHPLPWLAPQAQEDFRRILKMTRANYMGLVIDAQVERQAIEGFRLGKPPGQIPEPPHDLDELEATEPDEEMEGADEDLWRIWQSNNMDADFDQALLESAIYGVSYLLVAPNNEDPSTPHIFIEHPTQCIIAPKAGTNRRETEAGLKVWEDEVTGKMYATLYLPEWIYKFEADKPKVVRRHDDGTATHGRIYWEPRAVEGEEFPAPNDVGEVPLYELANNPRMLTGGVSEISDLLDIQDRVNKTIADRLMTQDYGAFPQKWAAGWPSEDENGNPTAPIEVGRNRMVTTDVSKTDVAFGQWDAAPIDGYSLAKREDVKDIASRSRTPAQYLLGEMSNVNGETLKASESGLVAKVRQRNRSISDPTERAMRAVRRLAGLPPLNEYGMEVIWRNPEFRTEGELVDALVKMSTLRVPFEALWEKWGATPTEIGRWKKMAAEQQRRTDLQAVLVERYRQTVAMEAQGALGQGMTPAKGSPLNRTIAQGTMTDADADGLVNEDAVR